MAEITIPAPKADVDDVVDVLNYRCCPPQWERGTVVAVQYEGRFKPKSFRWKYEIAVERYAVRLYVGDDAVALREEVARG